MGAAWAQMTALHLIKKEHKFISRIFVIGTAPFIWMLKAQRRQILTYFKSRMWMFVKARTNADASYAFIDPSVLQYPINPRGTPLSLREKLQLRPLPIIVLKHDTLHNDKIVLVPLQLPMHTQYDHVKGGFITFHNPDVVMKKISTEDFDYFADRQLHNWDNIRQTLLAFCFQHHKKEQHFSDDDDNSEDDGVIFTDSSNESGDGLH